MWSLNGSSHHLDVIAVMMVMMMTSQAPWVSIKAEHIQVDAAAAIDTSGTAPADMQQNGVDNPSGGGCLNSLLV